MQVFLLAVAAASGIVFLKIADMVMARSHWPFDHWEMVLGLFATTISMGAAAFGLLILANGTPDTKLPRWCVSVSGGLLGFVVLVTIIKLSAWGAIPTEG